MKKLHKLFLGLCCLAMAFAACDNEDSFSTSTSDLLSFSADTVRFDTVVTTVGSSTRRFQVYNRNSQGLRIISIRLIDGASSGFRINIDGTYLGASSGYATSDIELHGNDSLSVFAEITPKEQGNDNPLLLQDELEFILENGLRQTVKLMAYGQDVYWLNGRTFGTDTTLTAGRPFVIYDSLCVAAGTTLTLKEGVQLYFHDKANLLVHGTLRAEGTMENPVVFRGDRTDRMFVYLPYDNTPGRWGGIRLYAESMNNYFNYSDIHSASFGITCETSVPTSDKLKIENSILHNIEGTGIALRNCRALVANTQISNTLGHCVDIMGGSVQFVQCTLAQFYPWDSNRGHALLFSNQDGDTPYPLERADFRNCLMTGYADDEVFGAKATDESVPFNFSFSNCFLNTTNADSDEHMANIRYDMKDNAVYKQGNFRVFDTTNFIYDFRLVPESKAINAGDAAWATNYPFDRLGVSRLADEAPDAGCYEYVPQP